MKNVDFSNQQLVKSFLRYIYLSDSVERTLNKLTSVFLCVCPLIDDKLRHNIVKVTVEPRAAGEWFRSKL